MEYVTLGCEECPMDTVAETVFTNCLALKRIEYVGTIPTSLKIQWSSDLEIESAKNILRCLLNLIDTNPFSATISFHENVWQALREEGNTSPNNNLWEEYLMDLGWNKG